ncbi:hypothetical protein AAULR_02914, partial [Lacticaseibacillus rhamnosus MTCC 5462]
LHIGDLKCLVASLGQFLISLINGHLLKIMQHLIKRER